MVAAWLAEPSDKEGDEFEVESRFLLPPDGKPLELTKTTFKIGSSDKPLHRFVTRFTVPPAITTAGMVLVESRIKKIGTEDWKSQTSPIIVEILPAPQTSPKPPTDGQA